MINGVVKIVLSLILLVAAVVMDVRKCKISNRLICIGLAAGLLIQIWELGARGIVSFIGNISIPVILLFLLFLMRALGAGDIKLFSVVGGIWNLKLLYVTVIAAFLVAAAMSLCKLLYYQNLISRLCIFWNYICQVSATGKISKYPRGPEGEQNIIHFSIAILIGFVIALGVVY